MRRRLPVKPGVISLKRGSMNKKDKIWWLGGAVLIAAISSLLFTVGVMNPFVPMPLYMVILGWLISYGLIAVMPIIYIFEFKILSDKKYFGKAILIAGLILSILNILYFIASWKYGFKYQGEMHTIIVAIENIIGFSVMLVLAFVSTVKKTKYLQYSSNLILFLLLSWCAFPYLGELP